MRTHLCITRLFVLHFSPSNGFHCLTDVWVCTLYGWVHMNSYINFYNAHSLNYCRFVSHFEFLLIKKHHLHIRTSAHFFYDRKSAKTVHNAHFLWVLTFDFHSHIYESIDFAFHMKRLEINVLKIFIYTSKWLNEKEKTEKRETNPFLLLAISHERFLSNEIKI